MVQTTDVLVVGAGPAGAAAAIRLARAGRDVMVIDKATFPRDKCCGDGLTTEALRLLEGLGLRPDTVENWNGVTDILIRDPRGREMTLPLPRNGHYAAVVPRLDLDARLVDVARAQGATLREGVGFTGIDQRADRVIVHTTTGETVHARYLIAADGMWSPVRKAVRACEGGYRGEWHAFRQYFSNVGPKAQHLVVWFEEDFLPGYAWSFPLPGQRANVGFGIMRGDRHRVQDMKRLWSELLEREHVRDVLGPEAAPEGNHKAWPIPARIDRLPLTAGRTLFVGDAAAATDPMTGEGIAQALSTGTAAAEAINAAGAQRSVVATTRYEAAVEQALFADHRFARALSRVLRSPRGATAALHAADLTPWTRRNFARWMFEDYPRALVFTPRRWHRGMFTAPGAYRDPILSLDAGAQALSHLG